MKKRDFEVTEFRLSDYQDLIPDIDFDDMYLDDEDFLPDYPGNRTLRERLNEINAL